MVIPLSTGLIADHFTGAYRTRQLGISSSISNVTLVLATSLTGWLATVDWHYPFLVYLLPGVALLMTLSLRKYKPDRPAAATIPAVPASPTDAAIGAVKWLPGIDVPRLGGLMLLYFLATYVVLVVTFNLPFLMQHYTLSSSASGVMISLFFLAIMLPGLFITWIIRKLKNATVFLPLLLICAGLLLIYLFKYEWTIGLGCFVAGIGYGVYPAADLRQERPDGRFEKYDAGAGAGDVGQLPGDPAVPFYRRSADRAVREVRFGRFPVRAERCDRAVDGGRRLPVPGKLRFRSSRFQRMKRSVGSKKRGSLALPLF